MSNMHGYVVTNCKCARTLAFQGASLSTRTEQYSRPVCNCCDTKESMVTTFPHMFPNIHNCLCNGCAVILEACLLPFSIACLTTFSSEL